MSELNKSNCKWNYKDELKQGGGGKGGGVGL